MSSSSCITSDQSPGHGAVAQQVSFPAPPRPPLIEKMSMTSEPAAFPRPGAPAIRAPARPPGAPPRRQRRHHGAVERRKHHLDPRAVAALDTHPPHATGRTRRVAWNLNWNWNRGLVMAVRRVSSRGRCRFTNFGLALQSAGSLGGGGAGRVGPGPAHVRVVTLWPLTPRPAIKSLTGRVGGVKKRGGLLKP